MSGDIVVKPKPPVFSAQDTTEKPQEQASVVNAPVYVVFVGDPFFDAVEGIKYDFNEGLRVKMPSEGGPWRVVFSDADSGVLLFNQDIGNDLVVASVKKYYIRFRLQIYHSEDLKKDPMAKPIFEHTYDATGRTVMVQLQVPTMGDTLGWFPYVEKFRVQNRCRVVAVLDAKFIPLLEKQYPEITFITSDRVEEYKPYACYYLGLFFKGDTNNQPCDFRYVGLHRTAGYILGVDPAEEPPRFDLSAPRRIKEPYVCVAAHSSSQCKYWNNPTGWREVVKFLKDSGYRVLCIDKDPEHGTGLVWNGMPYGAEDFTGALPLQERVNVLKDADFFVGLSSGLAWLAWGCHVPVVMISGFTHPTNEFYTPYRLINYNACNSCWNDMREDFDHYDFLWCPRHKGTDRQFECTRLITSAQVIDAIKRVPAYQYQKHVHASK